MNDRPVQSPIKYRRWVGAACLAVAIGLIWFAKDADKDTGVGLALLAMALLIVGVAFTLGSWAVDLYQRIKGRG